MDLIAIIPLEMKTRYGMNGKSLTEAITRQPLDLITHHNFNQNPNPLMVPFS
jgi:hypothetical protein